jgi:hypothetical protein
VLELGKSGSHGLARGTVPVLSDDAVVATLRASNWKEAATAEVGERSWVFRRAGSRELTGRWSADPADGVRLRGHQTSYLKGTWTLDLEGMPVDATVASWWKGSHRFSTGGELLAESSSVNGWSTRSRLAPQPRLRLDHAVFLLWFQLVLSRRTAATAAAT